MKQPLDHLSIDLPHRGASMTGRSPIWEPTKGFLNQLSNTFSLRLSAWVCGAMCLLSVLSCEKIVDFQQTAYEPRLIVYGALFADSIPSVLVGRSQSYYGWQEYSQEKYYVEGAEVSLQTANQIEQLVLGRFQKDFFSVRYGHYDTARTSIYQSESPSLLPDSAIRVYEGSKPLQPGKWYEFRAAHQGDEALSAVYIPHRVANVSARFRARDTSYSRSISYDVYDQYVEETNETRFELVISYDMQEEIPMYSRPDVTTSYVETGVFYEYDPVTGNATQLIKDVLITQRGGYFMKAGPGRVEQVVQVGAVGVRSISYGTYSTSNDFTNLPLEEEKLERLANGDTIDFVSRVQIVVSAAQEDVQELASSVFRQQGSLLDPLAEPTLLKSNLEDAVGIVCGMSLTEVIEVPVRAWRYQ